MTCETVQHAIDERLPGGPDGRPDDIAGHLAGCPACQAHAAGSASIGRALAQCHARAAALPEADLIAARERIAEAVALRRPAAPVQRRPGFLTVADPLLVWGTGLAVLLFVAFVGVLTWPRATREAQPRNVAVQPERAPEPLILTPEPVSTKLATKLVTKIEEPLTLTPEPVSTKLATKLATKIEEPELTGLPAFWAEYEALKASSKGISPGFL
ncbi:MAG: hypothetical protein GXY44_15235, partial [Phycisphaerales bacterium]|nr:hypothetical protein [Phycisphaerales bacterium]